MPTNRKKRDLKRGSPRAAAARKIRPVVGKVKARSGMEVRRAAEVGRNTVRMTVSLSRQAVHDAASIAKIAVARGSQALQREVVPDAVVAAERVAETAGKAFVSAAEVAMDIAKPLVPVAERTALVLVKVAQKALDTVKDGAVRIAGKERKEPSEDERRNA